MSNTEKVIYDLLNKVGAPKHIKGYKIASEAIKLQLEVDLELPIHKMYLVLGNRMDKSYQSIERNLRSLVQWVFANCDYTGINELFGNSIPVNGKMTNGQFIMTLSVEAKRLIKELEVKDDVNNGR